MRRPLGKFEDLAPGDRFKAASKAAREVLAHIEAGGSNEVVTVWGACVAYAGNMRSKGEVKNAADTEARFKRHVAGTKLATIELAKLRREHVKAWRSELAAKPVEVNPHAAKRGETVITRPRTGSALNRDLAAVRAALNFAKDEGLVTTDIAWVSSLTAVPGASKQRDVYLTQDQRRRMLASASEEFRPFLTALCALPLRLGAVAALKVGWFDKRTSTLHVVKDKAGAGRKIPIDGPALALVSEACRGKLPGAPMFGRANGKPWDRNTWGDEFDAAVEAAGDMPAGVVAYVMRHCVLTDLIQGGMGLAEVAAMAGTSIEMLAKHYHHLQPRSAKYLHLLAL